MKKFLLAYCSFVLLIMIAATIRASLDRGIFSAATEMGSDPWFQVTLLDTYFSFFIIYLWIAYKETSWGVRLLWFFLVMVLGNLAIALYLLGQVIKWDPKKGIHTLLTRSQDVAH